jgi:glucose-1-phosphate adenylyltransferase
MSLDGDGRIDAFVEKPSDGMPYADADGNVKASMGIYVFRRDVLQQLLEDDARLGDSSHDFGHDLIPRLVGRARAGAYLLRGANGQAAYWRDVGTLDAYWRTNLEMLDAPPGMDLADRAWPIRSHRAQLPAARFVYLGNDAPGIALQSMVADGCLIHGGTVDRSVLFSDVTVDEQSLVSECVVLPGARIGKRCRLRRAILEPGVLLEDGTVIGEDEAADRNRFEVSEGGVVLVTADAAKAAVRREARRAREKAGSKALSRVA